MRGDLGLKLNRLFVTSLLLFSLSSVVYGYLTGASFMLKGAFLGAATFGVAVWGVLVFCAYGIAKYTMNQTHSYRAWFLSGFLSFLLVIFLVLVVDAKNDWGQIFRFYISTVAFYVLPVFCIYEIFLKKPFVSKQLGKPVILLAVAICSFVLGIVIYFSKSGIVLQGNHNFAMQYLLSLLCLALPLCASVAGVRAKILSMKNHE
ncbi:MAG: hypothetical protein SWL02_10760 [Pseudomonadota bacterium]|nr:hypothetical protein [Pseudomonadota bacterium]